MNVNPLLTDTTTPVLPVMVIALALESRERRRLHRMVILLANQLIPAQVQVDRMVAGPIYGASKSCSSLVSTPSTDRNL